MQLNQLVQYFQIYRQNTTVRSKKEFERISFDSR